VIGEDTLAETAARDPALARLAPRWSATRTEDNLAVTFRRLERARRLRRAGALGALALGVVALAAGGVSRGGLARGPAIADRASRAPGSPGPLAARWQAPLAARWQAPLAARWQAPLAARWIDLPDGSTVALRDGRARAVVSSASPGRLELELAGGPAAFVVPARKARTVMVRTARVEVAILAAKFELSPAGERVRVSVDEGEVAVTWPGARAPATVRRGEDATFPPASPLAAPAPDEPAPRGAVLAAAPPAEPGSRAALERSRFRMQVARRDYAGAYRSLVAAPGVADRSPEDLMLAADAARLSGHPASAVPYLRRLLREHPADVRGPVAAFTLGRVLLAELGRPAEAADAFAQSRRLAPDGPLAADALAREVEAAARAGDGARARRAAADYVARYPRGPRAAEVRRASGLE
jgi:transmembrane sensor